MCADIFKIHKHDVKLQKTQKHKKGNTNCFRFRGKDELMLKTTSSMTFQGIISAAVNR